ncbi:unnamed protein product [Jaminaea pallidilutea]
MAHNPSSAQDEGVSRETSSARLHPSRPPLMNRTSSTRSTSSVTPRLSAGSFHSSSSGARGDGQSGGDEDADKDGFGSNLTTPRRSSTSARPVAASSPSSSRKRPSPSNRSTSWSPEELEAATSASSAHKSSSPSSPTSQPTSSSSRLFRQGSPTRSSTSSGPIPFATSASSMSHSIHPRRSSNLGIISSSPPPSSSREPDVFDAPAPRIASGEQRRGSRTDTSGFSNLRRSSSTAGIFDLETDAIEEDQEAPATSPSPPSSSSRGSTHVSHRSASSSFTDPFGVSRAQLQAQPHTPQQPQQQHAEPTPASAPRRVTANTLAVPSSGAGGLPHSTAGGSVGRFARSPFDTAPSFSSPLAYASILPNESADDFDLNAPRLASSARRRGSATSASPEEVEQSLKSFGLAQKPEQAEGEGGNQRSMQGAPPKHSPEATRSVHNVALSPPLDHRRVSNESAASVTSSRRRSSNEAQFKAAQMSSRQSSSRASSNMGPPMMIPHRRQQTPSSSSMSMSASTSPDEPMSHSFAPMQRDRSLRIHNKQPSEAGGDSMRWERTASGSFSIGSPSSASSQASTSPPVSWDPSRPFKTPASMSAAGNEAAGEVRTASGSTRRRKSIVASGLSGGAHRRARSLGGALMIAGGVMGEDSPLQHQPSAAAASSPVGGPDGVDPQLVAAIRAGDASIPGTPMSTEAGVSALPRSNAAYAVASSSTSSMSSPTSSLPATPLGSGIARPAHRRPSALSGNRPELRIVPNATAALRSSVETESPPENGVSEMSTSPTTRSRATTSPLLGRKDGRSTNTVDTGAGATPSSPSSSRSPTSTNDFPASRVSTSPERSTRSRLRSQTVASSSAASSGVGLESHDHYSPRSPTTQLSPTVGPGGARPTATLGDAIRLQRVPTSIRLAGDLSLSQSSQSLPPSSPRTLSPTTAQQPLPSTQAPHSEDARGTLSPVLQSQPQSQAQGLGIGGLATSAAQLPGGVKSSLQGRKSGPDSSPQLPATPQSSRRPSPMASEEWRSSFVPQSRTASEASSRHSSGRNSPILEHDAGRPLSSSLVGTLGAGEQLYTSNRSLRPPARDASDPLLPTAGLSTSLSTSSTLGAGLPPRFSQTRRDTIVPSNAGSAYAPLFSVSPTDPSFPQSGLVDRHPGPRRSAGQSSDTPESAARTSDTISRAQSNNTGATFDVPEATSAGRAMGNRMRAGRLSFAPATTVNSALMTPGSDLALASGTDEYARIIIQSRSAKMQKWRALNAEASTREDVAPAAVDDSETRQFPGASSLSPDRSVTNLGRRGTAIGLPDRFRQYRESNAADETIDADNSASVLPFARFGGLAASGEIEWVDWLDEYRRMKEVKLRAEEASEAAKEEEQATSTPPKAESNALPVSPTRSRRSPPLRKGTAGGEDPNSKTTQRMGTASSDSSSASASHTLLGVPVANASSERPTTPTTISASSSSSLMAGGTPRRPSEPPLHQQRARAPLGRSAPSPQRQGSMTTSASTITSPNRASRNLSLSPITSRVGATATSIALSTPSATKKKRHLGGKIEAWWSAVKSNFVPPSETRQADSHSGTASSQNFGGQRAEGDRSRLQARSSGHPTLLPRYASDSGGLQPAKVQKRPAPAPSVDPPTASSASSLSPLTSPQQAPVEQPLSTPLSRLRPVSSATDLQSRAGRKPPKSADSGQSKASSGSGGSSAQTSQLSGAKRRQHRLSLNLDKVGSAFDGRDMRRFGYGPSSGLSSGSRERMSPLSAGPSPRQAVHPLPLHSEEEKADIATADPAVVEKQDIVEQPAVREKESFAESPNVDKEATAAKPALLKAQEAQANTRKVSHSKDMTIQSIRQHIRHRLAASKESCDKELRRIVHAVNTFVEVKLQEQAKLSAAEAASDAGDGLDDDLVEMLGEGIQGLQLSEEQVDTGALETPAGTAPTTRPGLSRRSTTSSQYGETHLRPPSALDMPPFAAADPDETPRAFEEVGPGSASQQALPTPSRESPLPAADSQASLSGNSNKALHHRTASHSASRSASNSRATSRSHSPMPPMARTLAGASPLMSPVRRSRRLLTEDAPLEPYIPVLQDIVGVALDVADTSITSLIARSGACSEIISSVQSLGRVWEEHSDWPGRGWFVQLLLAVAGLSRVVEWWEAEKGFWNFDDDDEGKDAKPISFGFGQSAFESEMLPGALHSPVKGHISAVDFGGTRVPSTQVSSVTSSPALEPKDRRVFSDGDQATRFGGQALSSTPDHSQMSAIANELEKSETAASPQLATARADPAREQQQNVLMELTLDQERLIYVSPAWQDVIGSDPNFLLDTPITDLLAPADVGTFAEATRQLQLNESHTVEIAFRMLVRPVHNDSSASEEDQVDLFQEMEGKGMLMRDREHGMPSHTMWVFKPVGPPEAEAELSSSPHKAGEAAPLQSVITAASISTEPILCRICERDVPTWFFEKHSEICNEVHRLEMEIGDCNETLSDLRKSVRAIIDKLEEDPPTPAEYRGALLTTPAASQDPPSALEHLQKSLAPRHPHAATVRKMHFRTLEALLDILQVAKDISTPSIKEDELAGPIEKQRLLSPTSENRIVQIRGWTAPAIDDPAIEVLAADVEGAIRNKLSVVNRTLNTIVYVETVRVEWEERVDAALAQVGHDGSDSGGSTASGSSAAGGSADGHETVETAPAIPRPPLTEDEEDAAETSAILLERNEREEKQAAEPGSTRVVPALAEDDDIPIVEGQLGGGSLSAARSQSAIPIPTASSATAPAHPSPLAVDDKQSETMPARSSQRGPSTSRSRSRQPSHLEAPDRFGTPPASPGLSRSEAGLTSASLRRISGAHHHHRMSMTTGTPTSPRLPPAAPSSRPTASSIKDFDIIKPISKGAFGSVYLARKRTTGDYYAIKVLKKSDMIAKNQITNVKAERMILMTQTQSPFVVKLYFTFQSKDYLYLVMEYLPGGDCASLCKMLGGLEEPWARQYIAEVVNGLESLHARGVVHRDLKPDNLLIDQKGHLKLTDFGLSKIGLLGRQTRASVPAAGSRHHKSDSSASSVGTSAPGLVRSESVRSGTGQAGGLSQSPSGSSPMTPGSLGMGRSPAFYVGSQVGRIASSEKDGGESSDAEPVSAWAGGEPHRVPYVPSGIDSPSLHPFDAATSPPLNGPQMTPYPSLPLDSRGHLAAAQIDTDNRAGVHHGQSPAGSSQQQAKKFVGTPDYLAPESILGIGMDDKAVDWWALGVILYEFLYGYPPFHAETPELVFDNILSRNIDWEEDSIEISPAARDLMERLMCTDRNGRLGSSGIEEVKAHPFFNGVDWENVVAAEGPFVPQISDPESTDYFDLRGAIQQDFDHEYNTPAPSVTAFAKAIENKRLMEPNRPPSRLKLLKGRFERSHPEQQTDEFGSFSYKNLPVLKQANDEVIKRLRDEQMSQLEQQQVASSQSGSSGRKRSLSSKLAMRNASQAQQQVPRPSSPATSVSSQSSSAPPKPRNPSSPAVVPLVNKHKRVPHPDFVTVPASGSSSSSSPGPTSASGSASLDRTRSCFGPAATLDSTEESDSAQLAAQQRTSSFGRTTEGSKGTGIVVPPHKRRLTQSGLVGASGQNQSTSAHGEGGSRSVSGSAVPSAGEHASQAEALPECLLAEDNPISQRMMRQMLARIGCKATAVRNGAEAVRLGMSDIKYAALFIDLTLPIVNGQDVARMVKSTRNANSQTPIIALASFDRDEPLDVSKSVFDGCLAKPVDSADLRALMPGLLAQHALAINAPASAAGMNTQQTAAASQDTGLGLPLSLGAGIRHRSFTSHVSSSSSSSLSAAPRMLKQRTASGRTLVTIGRDDEATGCDSLQVPEQAIEDEAPAPAALSTDEMENLTSKLGTTRLTSGADTGIAKAQGGNASGESK